MIINSVSKSGDKAMSIHKVFYSAIFEGKKDSLYACNLAGGTSSNMFNNVLLA